MRLLGHLADAGAWADYDDVARRLVQAAPDDPRSHLFLGLGLHERGRDGEADRAFQQGIALLSPAARRVFHDVALLLPKPARNGYAALDSAGRAELSRIVFASKDPVFLTEANERRLEHYARVAWAELKFSRPASAVHGWDTERGEIWIRYGAPWKWVQCCHGERAPRYVYWSYGPNGPNFVFTRRLTYRRAHMTEEARVLADDLAAVAPEAYQPKTIPSIHPLPHQLARFRGSAPGLTRVEIYAAPPRDSLAVGPDGGIEAGIFLFDPAYHPLWEKRLELDARRASPRLTYRFEVPSAEYIYAIEARATGPDSFPRPAARARERFETPGFPEGSLALSDILLADSIRSRIAAPVRRTDLLLAPKPATTVAGGAALEVYFETYGLAPDSSGLARYRAELVVADSTRRNLVERLARGVQELFRRTPDEPRVRWERTAPVIGGVVIDYLRIELPALGPGEYMLEIDVTDLANGSTAESRRRFRVLPGRP